MANAQNKIAFGVKMKIVNQKTTGKVSLLFALTLAFALLLPSIGTATQCLSSVESSADLSATATTGSDAAISVTPSGSCSSGEISSLSLSYQPNTLTVSNPSTGSYSGINTGVTKSFTVTASTTGVYNITAVGATSDGSVEASPLFIEFVATSSLTVDGSPSSATILQSASATLQVNITNSQASNITTSYTLTAPGNFTSSGDPTTSTSTLVNSGNTKALSWTITHSSCFTGKKNITFQLGDNTNAFVSEITGNTSCGSAAASTTTTTTTGGGGGGANATNASTALAVKRLSTTAVSAGLITVNVPLITTNTIETTDLSANSGLTGVTSVGIVVNSYQGKFRYYLSSLPAKPSSISSDPAGTLYKLIEITTENITAGNVKNVEISFEVDKTWITANKIDPAKVTLYRFTTSWNKLDTAKTTEDSNKYYYKASSPGFSVFAMAGEILTAQPPAEQQPSGTGEGTGIQGEGAGTNQTGPPAAPLNIPTDLVAGIVAVILIILAAKFLLPRIRERRISSSYKKAKVKVRDR